ncbi:MAG: glutamyl-tRNA reductase, partial [Actinomycetota bacterium]|nr:glutamyl-tRNA reductase [Actinomycetota bacterium]
LGAGDMGEGMAVALARSTAGEVLVANRTRSRARALAARVGGRAVELGALGPALEEVDVLLTSTGSTEVLVEADDLAAVMSARRGRPLLVVDVAVPRDVDPGAGEIEGVTLLDMDDLRAFAEAGLAARHAEVAGVEAIIGDEVERHAALTSARQVAPLVVALRQHAESVRVAELERHAAKLAELDPSQRDAVDSLTRGLLAKLLHQPTAALKDTAGSARGERLAEALRALFDL